MGGGVIFGPIVSIIKGLGLQKNWNCCWFIALSSAELHVHDFCAFWLHLAINDSLGHGIVHLNCCGGLCVPHFFKNVSLFDCFSCIDVKCPQFCFCGRGHNGFYHFSNIMNCPIVWGEGHIFGEIVVSSCLAACICFIEVSDMLQYSPFQNWPVILTGTLPKSYQGWLGSLTHHLGPNDSGCQIICMVP